MPLSMYHLALSGVTLLFHQSGGIEMVSIHTVDTCERLYSVWIIKDDFTNASYLLHDFIRRIRSAAYSGELRLKLLTIPVGLSTSIIIPCLGSI